MMKTMPKILIVVALVVAAGAALYLKQQRADVSAANQQQATAVAGEDVSTETVSTENVPSPSLQQVGSRHVLPRLIDLGADKCIPCKMMAPILEELKQEYAGKMDVQFVDVWKNPAPGKKYGIRVIPTQIFFDASGKELFRHEGFISKEDILAKWRELGQNFGASAQLPK